MKKANKQACLEYLTYEHTRTVTEELGVIRTTFIKIYSNSIPLRVSVNCVRS